MYYCSKVRNAFHFRGSAVRLPRTGVRLDLLDLGFLTEPTNPGTPTLHEDEIVRRNLPLPHPTNPSCWVGSL